MTKIRLLLAFSLLLSGVKGALPASQITSLTFQGTSPLMYTAQQPAQAQGQVYGIAAPAYAIGLIVTVSAGASLTYTVQITGDPQPSPNGNWNSHDVLVSQTGSMNSNIAYPVTAVRLVVSAYSSGSVTLAVVTWP